MAAPKDVDDYLSRHEDFRDVLEKLRGVLTALPLEETIKWSAPCYTYGGKNVIGMVAFKQHCALWFHQGALLADDAGHFEDPEAVKSKAKAMRQWRFASVGDVKVRDLKRYAKEAIALVDAGREIAPDRSRPVTVPPELQKALARSAAAKKAFAALTPGRRREYADHVAEAKRADTKQRRIEKILPMIEAGVGLHDKYRNC